MSDSHGTTPAAWTAVVVGLLGFGVGAGGLMLDPISMLIFWVGLAITVGALVVYAVMSKLGFNGSNH